jgi:hypothetical protein
MHDRQRMALPAGLIETFWHKAHNIANAQILNATA